MEFDHLPGVFNVRQEFNKPRDQGLHPVLLPLVLSYNKEKRGFGRVLLGPLTLPFRDPEKGMNPKEAPRGSSRRGVEVLRWYRGTDTDVGYYHEFMSPIKDK